MTFDPYVCDDSLVPLIRERSTELLPQPTNEAPKLPALPDVRAILFDVYGTLVISGSGDISLAKSESRDQPLRESLAEYNLPQPEGRLDEAFTRAIHEAQNRRRAEGIEFPEVEIREVWQTFLAAIVETELPAGPLQQLALGYELRVNPVWPMPDLREVIFWIQQARIPTGIVSNAQFFTPLLFQAFLDHKPEDLGFVPERCVWSYVEREGKPSRRLYEDMARKLHETTGFSPAQALYVGNDIRNDIGPAQAVGFRTALFAGDARSLRWRRDDPTYGTIQPDAVLTQLAQLREIVSL